MKIHFAINFGEDEIKATAKIRISFPEYGGKHFPADTESRIVGCVSEFKSAISADDAINQACLRLNRSKLKFCKIIGLPGESTEPSYYELDFYLAGPSVPQYLREPVTSTLQKIITKVFTKEALAPALRARGVLFSDDRPTIEDLLRNHKLSALINVEFCFFPSGVAP